jgi:1-acyl-sn-glycerol-3-phosphate acyltransferase
MKALILVLRFFYSIYAFAIFVLLMFIAFPFVMISLLFGKIKGGNIIYQICRVWGGTWYTLIGMRHSNLYEQPHNQQIQYIFVANHISYLDIPQVLMFTQQPLRILGKAEMVKIPIFGWIYRAAVILVDRTNAETRAKSVRALKAAIRNNISIFIFPEGTFNETSDPLKSFFDGAFRIAIETQTPIKPVLLVDTIDRLHYHSIFSLSPGKNRVVYLEEVPVSGLTIKDIPALKERVFQLMELGLKRYRNYPENSVKSHIS